MRVRIKNWSNFQHYKDRCPPWIKLHFKILHSRDWVSASDADRVLAIACMLIASQDEANDGSFDADPDYFFRVAYLSSRPDFTNLIKNGFLEPLSNASECYQTIEKCTTETETETETKTDILVASKLPTCPHQEILFLFSEELPELPQPRVWEGAREKDLSSRWRWVLDHLKKKGKDQTKEEGLEFFRRMFAYVRESDFLMGKSSAWSCDLGWIIKANNFAKIIEGNYHKEAA